MVDLGEIKKVDLREVWPHEAQDFTPWLAENIDKLGEALGLDLEFQEREAPVGPFFLDVLAHDRSGDRPVIIENQLEATNHSHLGQLLTYAAGYDAGVIIWLTGDFQDEHRQALDWLNQRTGEDTAFFGVVVEAWQIDGSRPAPHFRVVAMPNNWQKQATQSKEGSPKGERYRAFFQPLTDVCREKHKLTNSKTAQAKSWQNFKAGFSGFNYGTSFGNNFARVELYIDCGDIGLNKDRFDQLRAQKYDIEQELASGLDWQRLDHARACRISVVRDGATVDDGPHELTATRAWMQDYLLKFRDVFGPHLAELAK